MVGGSGFLKEETGRNVIIPILKRVRSHCNIVQWVAWNHPHRR